MKYDKMVEVTQAESQRKVAAAKRAISGMLEGMERITVAELTRRTGLSRGFFYKNAAVRRELDEAICSQKEIFKNRPPVVKGKGVDAVMAGLRAELLETKARNEELGIQNQNLSEDNEQLRKQVEKLQKQLVKKEISLLKSL